jgi:hypothetical protein
VRQVRQPHYDGPHERAEELGDDVAYRDAPSRERSRELVGHGEGDGDGGVDVSARELPDAVDGYGDGHRPPEGNDDPARVLGLGVPQQHARDDAVAKDNQDHGAEKLGDVR